VSRTVGRLPALLGAGYGRAMAFPRRLLADGERLILDLRPHWVALVIPVVGAALIAGGTVAALMYLPDSWPTWSRFVLVVAALALFIWYPAREIVAWLTSHFVVTSDRLIQRAGWLAKRSMEIPLEKISDVRFNQSVFERLIGAGDLVIESPGEFGQNRFTDIRQPEQVQKLIFETGEENQRRMEAEGRPSGVGDELATLDRLRDEGVLTDQEFEAEKARLLRRP
jgi:uncharacterized membrane protein YdbT with pleckstrin-like domain